MKTTAQPSAILELVLAAAFWGFGFTAAIWALRGMGPLAITGWRFVIAAVVGLAITFSVPSLRQGASWSQFRLAAIPGFLISLTLVLQTWGLKWTTATKSGFLTTLYVLLVPVLERAWMKRKLPRFHYLYVVLALAGVGLICDLPREILGYGAAETAAELEAQKWNFGDVLTMACAVAATLHILFFGVVHDRIASSFTFNNFQSVWAFLIPLPLSLWLEPVPTPTFADRSIIGLLMLAFGSTLIAFALQVRAQKKIAPSLASLLFLLESPFATLFAIYFLSESLRTEQWAGAGLILVAAALSTVYSVEVAEESFDEEGR